MYISDRHGLQRRAARAPGPEGPGVCIDTVFYHWCCCYYLAIGMLSALIAIAVMIVRHSLGDYAQLHESHAMCHGVCSRRRRSERCITLVVYSIVWYSLL